MNYTSHYISPLGGILLASDGEALIGLWFEGQKYYARGLGEYREDSELPVFERAKAWLDLYFAGHEPKTEVPIKLRGTAFQNEVWLILQTIPYGETVTYGQIAAMIAERRGIKKMSARAVGSAVGKNAVSIIVPCHRVLAADGALAGYAGGLERKRALLALENITLNK